MVERMAPINAVRLRTRAGQIERLTVDGNDVDATLVEGVQLNVVRGELPEVVLSLTSDADVKLDAATVVVVDVAGTAAAVEQITPDEVEAWVREHSPPSLRDSVAKGYLEAIVALLRERDT